MPIEDSNEEEILRLLGGSAKPGANRQDNVHGANRPEKESFNLDEESSEGEIGNIIAGAGSSEYKRVGFEDPVEMLYFIDENLASGRTKLWDWQVETLVFLSKDIHDFESRLKFCLTAANGSGKDAYILAPFAVFQCTEWIRSRFIGTSKSAHQLNTQTTQYIKQLCVQYGNKLIRQGFHPKPFVMRGKPFHIVCSFTGAEILCFVTDEAENIEGYHPWRDAPKAPLTIAINEAKGVPDEYFDGFSRCTYSRWIEITSPGRKTGRNWEHYDSSIKYPEKKAPGKFYSRKITSYDCPHKSPASIEEDAVQFGGKDSELFRSKHLAEYTSLGETIVIDIDVIDKYIKEPPVWDGNKELTGGLDLSLGGDETVLVTREGNRTKYFDGTRIRNAILLESYLEKLFINRGYIKGKTLVYTDIGGLGEPIFHHLIDRGWRLVPILNNTPAIGFDKHLYGNRGTEIYFDVANHYARGKIVPLAHKLWREQLGSRKYIRPDNEKIKLQPKAQLKKDKDKRALANSKEWESPDYADAWVLAFANFEPADVLAQRAAKKQETGKLLSRVRMEDLVEKYNEIKFAGYKVPKELGFRPTMPSHRRLIEEQLKWLNENK